jgi:hypothetical protein
MTSRLRKESTQIDFLKVDTEGYDLKVLEGAERLLRSGAVAFIQVEAGMNPHNVKHVPLEVLKMHLEGRGYTLFALSSRLPNRAANRVCDSRMPHSWPKRLPRSEGLQA